MLVNQKTAIVGKDVVLVPYRPEHVETYHMWMLSPELRELTASEPLTLEEEHQMQRNWQTDADKLTFIILARSHLIVSGTSMNVDPNTIPTREEILTFPMIGDVNLFLKETHQDGDEEVEAEVMIADTAYRRKGVAQSALHLLFHYATSSSGPLHIPPERLIVRIGETNAASIRLFEKLSFHVTKRVPVFQEVELRYRGDGTWAGGQCIQFD
ncbi:hypothetical protein K439DRAFT_1418141 [Ramaria rubella]|nr:hypothetical protein K439DRAFT_1418141 [Ramaria rubella]